jgi:hypothetical protein
VTKGQRQVVVLLWVRLWLEFGDSRVGLCGSGRRFASARCFRVCVSPGYAALRFAPLLQTQAAPATIPVPGIAFVASSASTRQRNARDFQNGGPRDGSCLRSSVGCPMARKDRPTSRSSASMARRRIRPSHFMHCKMSKPNVRLRSSALGR